MQRQGSFCTCMLQQSYDGRTSVQDTEQFKNIKHQCLRVASRDHMIMSFGFCGQLVAQPGLQFRAMPLQTSNWDKLNVSLSLR